jgi:hypothetical protein
MASLKSSFQQRDLSQGLYDTKSESSFSQLLTEEGMKFIDTVAENCVAILA